MHRKSSRTISIYYDQTSNGNHLTKAPGGGAVNGPNDDDEAVADTGYFNLDWLAIVDSSTMLLSGTNTIP